MLAAFSSVPPPGARTIKQFFDWCEDHRLGLDDIEPIAIAAYIEELGAKIARPSVKQHLAAIRQLLNSIDVSELIGLRDCALLGLMGYTFARVSAVVTLRVEDYFQQGRRSWVRLNEKGGKRHEVPCHHSLDEYLDA